MSLRIAFPSSLSTVSSWRLRILAVASLDAFTSSFPSNHILNASFNGVSRFRSKNEFILVSSNNLFDSAANLIPYPYSAASSNNELPQAGPLPDSWLIVYDIAGALAPQIDEQPVAFATYILSPNNCVTSLAYGVSPQPAQAPENCSNGCLNWLPLSVLSSITSSL